MQYIYLGREDYHHIHVRYGYVQLGGVKNRFSQIVHHFDIKQGYYYKPRFPNLLLPSVGKLYFKLGVYWYA